MDARSRRKLGMAANAADFSRGHPDESEGYQAVLSSVEEKLARAKEALAEQRSGLLGVHANATRKLELRRTMRDAHLAHLAQVGRAARREAPEVAQKFVFRLGTSTHVAFQTTARAFLGEAETHRELLVRYGLVERAERTSAVARTVRRRDGERCGGQGRACEGQRGAPAAGGRGAPGGEGAGSLQPGAIQGDAGGIGGVAEREQHDGTVTRGEDRA